MIIGTAPVRISFAGGGTDMPEYYNEYGGNVITTSIGLFTYSIVHPRHDHSFQAFSPDFQKHYKPTTFDKIEIADGTEIASSVIKYLKYKSGINIMLSSDVPAGSGLGASSSLAVNLVNTILSLKHEVWSKHKIAETAFHIGRNILNWPIGKQDEYISAFGGFNFIDFQREKVKVLPVKITKSTLSELENNILLFFIGQTRNSSIVLSQQIKRIKAKEKDMLASLDYVKELAQTMHKSLIKSDITKFGELLNSGWMAKKKFAKVVTNPYVDKVYENALENGAIGGKLAGAGGGGHMIFYCESNRQKKLIEKMKSMGIKQVKFTFYDSGPKIHNLYDYTK